MVKDEVAEDFIKEKVVKNIRETLDRMYEVIEAMLEGMKEAETVDEFMRLKKNLLVRWLEFMPLGIAHCYFCMMHFDEADDWPICELCWYGDMHGICSKEGSDFSIICDLYKELIRLIEELYW